MLIDDTIVATATRSLLDRGIEARYAGKLEHRGRNGNSIAPGSRPPVFRGAPRAPPRRNGNSIASGSRQPRYPSTRAARPGSQRQLDRFWIEATVGSETRATAAALQRQLDRFWIEASHLLRARAATATRSLLDRGSGRLRERGVTETTLQRQLDRFWIEAERSVDEHRPRLPRCNGNSIAPGSRRRESRRRNGNSIAPGSRLWVGVTSRPRRSALDRGRVGQHVASHLALVATATRSLLDRGDEEKVKRLTGDDRRNGNSIAPGSRLERRLHPPAPSWIEARPGRPRRARPTRAAMATRSLLDRGGIIRYRHSFEGNRCNGNSIASGSRPLRGLLVRRQNTGCNGNSIASGSRRWTSRAGRSSTTCCNGNSIASGSRHAWSPLDLSNQELLQWQLDRFWIEARCFWIEARRRLRWHRSRGSCRRNGNSIASGSRRSTSGRLPSRPVWSQRQLDRFWIEACATKARAGDRRTSQRQLDRFWIEACPWSRTSRRRSAVATATRSLLDRGAGSPVPNPRAAPVATAARSLLDRGFWSIGCTGASCDVATATRSLLDRGRSTGGSECIGLIVATATRSLLDRGSPAKNSGPRGSRCRNGNSIAPGSRQPEVALFHIVPSRRNGNSIAPGSRHPSPAR